MARVTLLRIKRGNKLQYQVADEAGIPPSRYNMIENLQIKSVKAEDAKSIATTLGCRVEDLFLPVTFRPIEVEP